MNRIKQTIRDKGGNILNVFFTAGYPRMESTPTIIKALDKAGVDLIEFGMPYSDPLAEGPTIQKSSEVVLKNGLTLDLLFDQIEAAREHTEVPIIMMGYFNQLLQYGVERFVKKAAECRVDGFIIPDLPMSVYEREYKEMFDRYGIGMSFLITPLTSTERIREADRLSSGFLYVVSSSSTTGKSGEISKEQKDYFTRISDMNLNNPWLIGFGIHDKVTFDTACKYADGAIIGSAYIRAISNPDTIAENTASFIYNIRN